MHGRAAIAFSSSLAALALSAGDASALCVYKGQLYARTTVDQEYADSARVVVADVVSASNRFHLDRDDDWGTLYKLKVVKALKGSSGNDLSLFTPRDSGGFYLNVGGRYLLFLDAAAVNAARGTFVVNYNCGQSRPWSAVNGADRYRLARLSQAR
jgi:hypothetical protein